MRMFCVPKQFYQASRLNGQPLSEKAIFRLEKIKLFLGLKGKGLSSKESLEVLPIRKFTLYRWLAAYKKHGPRGLEPRSTKPHRIRNAQYDLMLVRRILYLRRQHPVWGKAKITWLLRKEGTHASESTVGSILSNLMRKGRILSTWALRKQCPVFYKKRKANRKHAVRLPKGLKPEVPGEIVQVDTMTLNLFSGVRIKQFTAYCRARQSSMVA